MVIAGLSALSTMAQPCAASTAASRVTISTTSVPRAANAALPGRTRLLTRQPASRNASAAAWPKRPPAPMTRMLSLMTASRRDMLQDWHSAPRGAICIGMGQFMSQYIVPIAIGAVAIVLLLGLINMMRGGSPNTSQKLMRLRVLLQFVAIVVIMATIWAMGR